MDDCLFVAIYSSKLFFNNNQRLNQVTGLILHQHEGRLNILKAHESMGDQLFGMDTTCHDQIRQLFHAQSATGHQTAADLLVTHAATPFHSGNTYAVAFAQIVHIADDSAGLEYLDSLCERIGYSIVNKMAENFKERMLGRIKELINDRCFGEILHTDVMSLRKNFRVSVPVFRVDYEYIKVADCENIFGRG